MGTSCIVIRQNKDGTCNAVTFSHDGYWDHTYDVLRRCYASEELVAGLFDKYGRGSAIKEQPYEIGWYEDEGGYETYKQLSDVPVSEYEFAYLWRDDEWFAEYNRGWVNYSIEKLEYLQLLDIMDRQDARIIRKYVAQLESGSN